MHKSQGISPVFSSLMLYQNTQHANIAIRAQTKSKIETVVSDKDGLYSIGFVHFDTVLTPPYFECDWHIKSSSSAVEFDPVHKLNIFSPVSVWHVSKLHSVVQNTGVIHCEMPNEAHCGKKSIVMIFHPSLK